MNNFKKWTATALALGLCLTMAACSTQEENNNTNTPATSSTTDNSMDTADQTEGGDESTDGEVGDESSDGAEIEATLDSYLEELMAFNEEIGLVEEKLVESGDSGEGIPADQEAIDLQIEILLAMSEAMSTAKNINAPEEMAQLQADFVAATEELVATAEATCDFLAEGFDPEDEEALATYAELGDAYLASYGPLSETLLAIMEELEAQMS